MKSTVRVPQRAFCNSRCSLILQRRRHHVCGDGVESEARLVAYAPLPSQVKDMVRLAMQDQAPVMFNELQASGKLEEALDQRATMYQEVLDQNLNQTMD